ncbi:MAG: IS701 family transposase [Streptosporangiaceae bacterium]
METNNTDTAASARIEDVADCAAQVDAQVKRVLGRVMAQRRSVEVAFAYAVALSPGTRANCWAIAEAAGHEGWHRMQGLLGSYVWDWKDLRAGLPALAAAWLPGDGADLIGPGIAIDETADLKAGDFTACVAPQHAGVTNSVENCVTTVFSAYVTPGGQAWADFDVYMPGRWAKDMPRRREAGIPDDLEFATKPQLAIRQLERLVAAGLPLRWAAADEVYGRSSKLRKACKKARIASVFIVPCNFTVTTPAGSAITAEEAVADAVFERRSCGNGSKGPRYSDWSLVATADPRESLLIRRLISRPDQYTFYLCYAPEGRPATLTCFVTIAGRRWPVEETFKTGKDVLGWDQSQTRSFDGICRHTALAALAQLRNIAIRNALTGAITLPPVPCENKAATAPGTRGDTAASDADLVISLGDAPVPGRGGQPCPRQISPIRLSVAETARLAALAKQHAAGLIDRSRLAFALRWSRRRRQHQAIARWHHYSARLAPVIT